MKIVAGKCFWWIR